MRKITWKHPGGGLCPSYTYGGWYYYIQQDIHHDWMWAVYKTPDRQIRIIKNKAFRTLYENLTGETEPGLSESEYREKILWLTRWESGSNLRTYISDDKEARYFAVDLKKKEFWEYFEPEKVSPYFSKEMELLEWADESLPQYEQLILELK